MENKYSFFKAWKDRDAHSLVKTVVCCILQLSGTAVRLVSLALCKGKKSYSTTNIVLFPLEVVMFFICIEFHLGFTCNF